MHRQTADRLSRIESDCSFPLDRRDVGFLKQVVQIAPAFIPDILQGTGERRIYKIEEVVDAPDGAVL